MTSEFERLLFWVREREAIRVRKEVDGLSFPWTDDPILRAWRFCNVRREDDRVTRWIAENIRERYAVYPYLWFMLCAARQINWPDTLAFLMSEPGAWPDDGNFSPAAMAKALSIWQELGEKVFTGAYIITAPQTKGTKKTTHVAEMTLGTLWRHRQEFADHFAKSPTLRSTCALLMMHNGWGPFLAYQAVVDMRFTHLLRDAPDVYKFAAAGPGTIRGLNRLAGRATNAAFSQDRALEEIRVLWSRIVDKTFVELDLSDVPNVLCEFDKYERVRLGEGEPRARYVPGRGS